jgi:hypothetical protein
LYPHVALLDEVAQQHTHDADRHRHGRRDLGDRLLVAQLDDATVLRVRPAVIV